MYVEVPENCNRTSLIMSLFLQPLIHTFFPYTTLFRSSARTRAATLSCTRLMRAGGIARSASIRTPLVEPQDRKSTRLNSSHVSISYAVFCSKTKKDDSSQLDNDVINRGYENNMIISCG